MAAGATLTLQNLTLQGGLATSGPNPVYGVIASGGAVDDLGAATLTGVTIQNNTAQGPDGSPGGDGVTAMGGGIFSGGSLTVDGCTIQNNQAIGGNGGKGYLSKDSRDRFGNEHIPPGNGGNGFGGGVFVGGGTASLHNCTVSGNTAQGAPAGGGNATDGLGEGGGVLYRPHRLGCLDAFTQANVTTNSASTPATTSTGPSQPASENDSAWHGRGSLPHAEVDTPALWPGRSARSLTAHGISRRSACRRELTVFLRSQPGTPAGDTHHESFPGPTFQSVSPPEGPPDLATPEAPVPAAARRPRRSDRPQHPDGPDQRRQRGGLPAGSDRRRAAATRSSSPGPPARRSR